MDKKKLSETDIISKFIMPAVQSAGWNLMKQIRQEVKLRDGKVIVRGQLGVRKTVKSADIVLYHKPNMPLAVIEAKANKHEIGKGMQQGLDYARLLEVPFIFASNGDGFIFHDKTNPAQLETRIELLIPIPPIEEQHRIVAKVDELMALCEQLKTRLSDTQATQLNLADAVVENALN